MFSRVLSAVLLLAPLACGDTPPSAPPPLLTALPRELTSEEQSIQQAANAFTFKLLSRLSDADPNKNIFVSPLSVSFALGMALNGASGETFTDLADGLELDGLSESQINQGFKGLIGLLSSLDPMVQMEIANSLWHSDLYTIQPTFSGALADYFNASANKRDFSLPATLSDINGWVSARTHGKIPSILESISPYEIMFLINAMYFHGKWREPFDPKRTQSAPFYMDGGGQASAQMMFQDSEKHALYSTQTITAARLTYGNGAFAIALLRPTDNQSIQDFVSSFNLQLWNQIRLGFQTGRFVLRMPKFKLDYKRSLQTDLEAIGIERAFQPNVAEFPRMVTANEGLFITRVEHKAAIDLDELGTTAAAATAVGVGVVSAPPQVDFDRPFVYLIYEQFSGTILFAGKFVAPPQQ